MALAATTMPYSIGIKLRFEKNYNLPTSFDSYVTDTFRVLEQHEMGNF